MVCFTHLALLDFPGLFVYLESRAGPEDPGRLQSYSDGTKDPRSLSAPSAGHKQSRCPET